MIQEYRDAAEIIFTRIYEKMCPSDAITNAVYECKNVEKGVTEQLIIFDIELKNPAPKNHRPSKINGKTPNRRAEPDASTEKEDGMSMLSIQSTIYQHLYHTKESQPASEKKKRNYPDNVYDLI